MLDNQQIIISNQNNMMSLINNLGNQINNRIFNLEQSIKEGNEITRKIYDSIDLSLNQITQNLNRIENNTNQISINSAITAFNSERIQKEINYLRRMDDLEKGRWWNL